MDEIKGIRIVSLTGEKEYGIEDSEVREELANVVDGAPEELDSFKEAFEKFKEGGEALAGIADEVAAVGKAVADEAARAQSAEQVLDEKIAEEQRRATEAEQGIEAKALDAGSAKFEATENAVALKFTTIEGVGDEITIPAATTERAGVMTAEDKIAIDAVPSKIESAVSEESKATDEKISVEIEKIKDGDTIVGQAREIHSRNGKTVPDSFLVRTTAGSGTIGDGVATLKSVGGNIVKNMVDATSYTKWKLTKKTDILEYNDGVYTLVRDMSNAYSAINWLERCSSNFHVAGHSYYYKCAIKASNINKRSDIVFGVCNGAGASYTSTYANIQDGWQILSLKVDIANTLSIYYGCALVDLRTDNNIIHIKDWLVIDLTEMYGAGNEPTKEECDKMFGTMDALPQGLTIANPTEFKSTGFNQFNPDNVLEGKAIVNNAIESGDKKIAVIPCLPCKVGVGENNGYCIHGDFGADINVYLTPLNPMEVDGELYMHKLTKDATTDTYVPLIKGYLLVEVPTTTNLCAHFLWSEDKCERDTYEPYFESKIELPEIPQMSEWGLAGIQSSGTLAADTIDFERGVYIKRIGRVDIGTMAWNIVTVKTPDETSTYSMFQSYALNGKFLKPKQGGIANGMVEGYTPIPSKPYATQEIGNRCIMLYHTGYSYIRDNAYANADAFKAAMQGVMLYYELAEPEEYPLPKVDNNYISSDYGVEQFDSVVPCNANNLYYMRSLAGETRNFLDRLYDNTAKADTKEVADYITNGIEGNKELATNAPNLALRALYVAAGAEYNNTNTNIVKTTPWADYVDSAEYRAQWNLDVLTGTVQTFVSDANVTYEYIDDGGEWKIVTRVGDKLVWDDTKVVHRSGCYYLSGLGHLTDSDMITIYNNKDGLYKYYHRANQQYQGKTYYPVNNRLMYTQSNIFIYNSSCFQQNFNASVILFFKESYKKDFTGAAFIDSSTVFYDCNNLRVVMAVKSKTNGTKSNFYNCKKLSTLLFFGVKDNVNLSELPVISKSSILFMLENANPTTTITITLHADAYARLAEDADVVAALAAQPLITLVSA